MTIYAATSVNISTINFESSLEYCIDLFFHNELNDTKIYNIPAS